MGTRFGANSGTALMVSELSWFRFMDMHGGGDTKTPYAYVYVQSVNMDEAVEAFQDYLHVDPLKTTCTCCGEDFSIREGTTLEEASKYERHGHTLGAWLERKDILVLSAPGGD